MADTNQSEAPRLYPKLRCRDADVMIAWLTGVLGFTERVTYRDPAGVVEHAELASGPSILMLGQDGDDEYGALIGHCSGRRTDSLYLAVDKADALHDRVAAAGATIVMQLHDTDYGSRDSPAAIPRAICGTFKPSAEQPDDQ